MLKVLALIVSSLAAAIVPNELSASPRIEIVGGERVDLGRGRPGRYVHQLAISNAGDDTLHILSINSDCGCLVGELDRTAIGPGDTARVQLTVETSGQVVDRWSRAIGIASNDPARPVVDVIVHVAFQHDLRLETLINTIHRERCDDGCQWTIALENISDDDLLVNPPFIEEMRGVSVEFDLLKPRLLAPGKRVVITGRVRVIGGEDIPSARVVIATSGQFDPSTSLAWFYLPEPR